MYLDIHAHMYKYPYPLSYDREKDEFQMLFPNGEQLVKLHDEIGIDRAVIVPLVSSEVYVPQSVGEVIEFILKHDRAVSPKEKNKVLGSI